MKHVKVWSVTVVVAAGLSASCFGAVAGQRRDPPADASSGDAFFKARPISVDASFTDASSRDTNDVAHDAGHTDASPVDATLDARVGFSFREPDDASLPQGFSIVTTKKLRDAEGSIIWVVAGEGKPRDYRLESWFRVERFSAPGESEPYEASGPGVAFRPDGIRLNKLAWFPELMKAMAHFSLGTQRLSDEQADRFVEAARASGFVVPGPGRAVETGPAVLLTESSGPAPRTIVEVNRLVRDSAVSLTVKTLHGCRCQVCGVVKHGARRIFLEHKRTALNHPPSFAGQGPNDSVSAPSGPPSPRLQPEESMLPGDGCSSVLSTNPEYVNREQYP